MAITIEDADTYIYSNVVVVEDWEDSDDNRKQRILNVAARELTAAFPDYTIPDNAVYEFSAVIATLLNDTNKYAQQGVKAFGLSGVANFTFEDAAFNSDLTKYIPKTATDIINADPDNEDKPPVSVGKKAFYTVI